MRLAEDVLAISPDDRDGVTRRRSVLPPEAQIRFDLYDYAVILTKHFPALVVAAPEQATSLLCDLLANAVAYSQPSHQRDDYEDSSYVWCPSVDQCGPGDRHELLNALTVAARDAARAWAQADPASVSRIVELFDSKRWQIFERLGYSLLRQFP
ncbi:MAG: hypothetical protein IID33_01510, partial [Planctomycetes bacterium]|nr:hypothetical protein [Planctomycetota bacterium]